MNTTLADTVASSSATTDIAYYVCIVSFFVAGGVAIYLLLDKVRQHNTAPAKRARVIKPASRSKKAAPKKVVTKKVVAKKAVAKKPVKKTTKKK